MLELPRILRIRTGEKPRTGKTQIPQGAFVPLEVGVDLETLIVLVQCAQFAQEWQILPRVLQRLK